MEEAVMLACENTENSRVGVKRLCLVGEELSHHVEEPLVVGYAAGRLDLFLGQVTDRQTVDTASAAKNKAKQTKQRGGGQRASINRDTYIRRVFLLMTPK